MKLRERKQQTEPEARELPRLLVHLHDLRQQLAGAEKTVKEKELAVDDAQTVTADEFHGTIDPHEAARRRAAAEQEAVEARRVRDHLAALVEVGEEECLKLVDQLHQGREEKRLAKVEQARREGADAQARLLGVQARLQRLENESFDAQRAHVDARATVRSRERRDWENEDRELIRRFIEGTRHWAAGVTPLPARLQPAADQRLRALENAGVSDAYLDQVAANGGYARIRRDGGPAPLPDTFER